MAETRKTEIGAHFRKAGSTGRKTHVFSTNGHWSFFKEGANKVKGRYQSRKEAVQAAKQMLAIYKSDELVIHRADGTVEQLIAV